MDANIVLRFWANVDKRGPDECWIWLLSINKKTGYGQFSPTHSINKKSHRVAFEISKGSIGDKMVLHTCDNRKCCNPNHLFLGDQKINMADMVAKGRSPKPYGSLCGAAKLSESDVIQIRASGGPHKILASQYNVSESTISRILSRDIWRHI